MKAQPRLLPAWAIDPRVPQPAELLADAFYTLILSTEREFSNREGLLDTPHRAAGAWRELTCGYHQRLEMTTFPADGYDEIVAIRSLPFYSLCEHHLLPFHGTADFAYIPRDRILGLSKFARLLECYSRRLQVQERLTDQLAGRLEDELSPRAVLVIVRAEHLCMSMRGVQRPGHTTVTSVVGGAFKDKPEARAEALALLRGA